MTFPLPIMNLLKSKAAAMPEALAVVGRPLRPTDPNQSVGIFATTWDPQGLEIGQHEPVIQRYNFAIQFLLKAASEEEGNALHLTYARSVREMLYRDPAFPVEYGALQDISLGYKERAQRYAIARQRFLANEINGQFFFLSVTEPWFETETMFVGP